MELHGIVYHYEHKLLSRLFFEDKELFVTAVLKDPSFLFRVFDDLCQQVGIPNPYQEDQFCAKAAKITEQIMMLKISFPEPEDEPLCYTSYLFFDHSFEKISFYCIEKGGEHSDHMPFVCSWAADGTHRNHGNCTLEDKAAFLRCADLHTRSFYEIGYPAAIDLPEKLLPTVRDLLAEFRAFHYIPKQADELLRDISSDLKNMYEIVRDAEGMPVYEEFDEKVQGKNCLTYHFFVLLFSTELLEEFTQKDTLIVDIPQYIVDEYIRDERWMEFPDGTLLFPKLENHNQLTEDIAMFVHENTLRLEHIIKILTSV